jgi:hypothetical protein
LRYIWSSTIAKQQATETMLKFNPYYFAITVLLFITEIVIALFVNDQFIRPYGGDFLVVILIYCFLKSFVNLSVGVAATLVLLFSFFIETTQYFNAIGQLGLQDSEIAKAILGNSFAWNDILAYVAGILCVISIEMLVSKRTAKTDNAI